MNTLLDRRLFYCRSEQARDAVNQSTGIANLMASSLASQLPQGQGVYAGRATSRVNCGSWLASDGDRSVNGDAGSDGVIARIPPGVLRELHSSSRRRNGRQHTNQNSQHQKTTEKNRHLGHTALHPIKLRYRVMGMPCRWLIVSRWLLALQMQIARQNADQMVFSAGLARGCLAARILRARSTKGVMMSPRSVR